MGGCRAKLGILEATYKDFLDFTKNVAIKNVFISLLRIGGTCWRVLEAKLEVLRHLGGILEASWRLWEALGGTLEALGGILEIVGSILGAFWKLLEGF